MNVEELHARIRVGISRRDQDPLAWWKHSSPHSRKATELLSRYDEVYCRAANKAGKTQWQYAVGLAMLQKRPRLDGVALPQWRGKIEAVSLEIDHPTQKLSSQKVVLDLLGEWPSKVTRKGDDIVSTIRVKPVDGPSDEKHWSTLTFQSQENRKSGTGVRADLILANEPPRRDIWEEIRKAAEAGRRIVRIIGATPIRRKEWWWLADEYSPEAPRDGIRLHEDWAEVRWSLEHNSALSREEIDKLLRMYAKNPATYDARVYGDYCNTTGLCPFDEETLVKMLKDKAWAREPVELVQWRIPREVAEDGETVTEALIEVEVYSEPETGKSYYMPLDGSSGIDDAQHDPAGLHVAAYGSGDLAVRYTGPLASYRLGRLGVGLARQYKNAQMDPEANKWSMGVVKAIGDARYGNMAQEVRQMGYGEVSRTPGFTTDEKTRNASISAIQDWIEAYRVGAPYARPCRAIIECLLDVVFNNETGKYEAGPGAHDEDMILWGMVLQKCVSRRGKAIPDMGKPPRTPEQALVEMIQGKGKRNGLPMGGRVVLKQRRRP